MLLIRAELNLQSVPYKIPAKEQNSNEKNIDVYQKILKLITYAA